MRIIYLLLYPHGSDTNISRHKYVQSITIYTGSQRSHALHQSAPSSSLGYGVPLRCTRSSLLRPLGLVSWWLLILALSITLHYILILSNSYATHYPSHIPHKSHNEVQLILIIMLIIIIAIYCCVLCTFLGSRSSRWFWTNWTVVVKSAWLNS